jgi:hypothetical protein
MIIHKSVRSFKDVNNLWPIEGKRMIHGLRFAANFFVYYYHRIIFGFENYAERIDNLGFTKNPVCSKN